MFSVVLLASFLISVVLVLPVSCAVNIPSSGQIKDNAGGSLWNPWIDKEDSVQEYISLVNQYGGNYESIGKSSYNTDSRMPSDVRGDPDWDIVLFKFGNPNGGVVMVDSYLHGNEYYGYQTLLYVMKWVLSSSDADAVRIRNNNHLLIVPVVNYRMDRTNYNIPSWMTFDSYGDGEYKGVDLNRNFGPSWLSSLSRSNSDTSSGVSADSEAESQALIYAWNKYNPRVYWNLHQGIGPSTMCTAVSSQATSDANEIKNLLPSIQNSLGISSGWSFSVRSSYSNGFSKDGAASRGSAGFLTEVMSGWDSTASKKTSLETGTTFLNIKAMFIAMCQTVENPNGVYDPYIPPDPDGPEPEPTDPLPESPINFSLLILLGGGGLLIYAFAVSTKRGRQK